MFPGALSPIHILIVLGAVLIFLGPEEIPRATRALTRAWKELQAWRGTFSEHVDQLFDATDPKGPARGEPQE